MSDFMWAWSIMFAVGGVSSVVALVWFFGRNKAQEVPNKPIENIEVTEGLVGCWHYHLSKSGSRGTPLCGKEMTMPTNLPITLWGTVTHLHETYCKDCWAIHKGQQKKGE